MRPLPRLASVALAARCAELLAPCISDFWQHAPEAERTLVRTAISSAKQTAETGRAPDTLVALAGEITMLVGKLVLHLHGMPVETKLPQALMSLPDTRMRIIQTTIDVVARAARAATATNADDAFSECHDGVSWSYSVAEDLDAADVTNDLNSSIRLLYQFCDGEQLTDDSTVRWTGSGWSAS